MTAETASVSLTELELRQEGILSQLSALKGRVQDLSRKFDVKLTESDEYRHVVVHASPENATRAVVVMLRLISKLLACHSQVYVHSGLTAELDKRLLGLLDGLSGTKDNATVGVTWIWKEGTTNVLQL